MLNMRTITSIMIKGKSITNEPMFSIDINKIDIEMAAVTLIERYR